MYSALKVIVGCITMRLIYGKLKTEDKDMNWWVLFSVDKFCVRVLNEFLFYDTIIKLERHSNEIYSICVIDTIYVQIKSETRTHGQIVIAND